MGSRSLQGESPDKFSSALGASVSQRPSYEHVMLFFLSLCSREYFGGEKRKATATLPAAGYRNYSSGLTNNQGSNAYYWSSSTNGTSNGYYLNFNSSYVNPSNNADYSNGFNVRCVR